MNVCFLYSEARSSETGTGITPDIALIDTLTKRHDLRTVGELYDFLCERKLRYVAVYL